MTRTIVGFRRDLRIADHAPWPVPFAGVKWCLFSSSIGPYATTRKQTAPARVAFMLACLASLDADLRERGGRLIVRSGDPVEILPQLVREVEWTMQSGMTHCLDKSWTRVYNPQQAAIDRCDPEGLFIKRWVPELQHIPAANLGQPPKVAGYPSPILDYKQARQQRIATLERQRSRLLDTENLIPHLAGMPESWVPFGADRGRFETGWAQDVGALFPAALDLTSLSADQAKVLRTWFVAHVEIQPHRSGRSDSTPQRRKKGYDNPDQLSLFDLE